MKFFKQYNFFYSEIIFKNNIGENTEFFYNNSDLYIYDKFRLKKKGFLNKIRPGITTNKKKNSLLRDQNLSFLSQYLNINQRKGLKSTFFKNLNIAVNNLFFCFGDFVQDFEKYDNYKNLVFLYNNNFDYSDINKILYNSVKDLESVFEIRTIKNNKKLKLQNKYSHEIIYLPRERRSKYVLKALSLYKENFKKYNI